MEVQSQSDPRFSCGIFSTIVWKSSKLASSRGFFTYGKTRQFFFNKVKVKWFWWKRKWFWAYCTIPFHAAWLTRKRHANFPVLTAGKLMTSQCKSMVNAQGGRLIFLTCEIRLYTLANVPVKLSTEIKLNVKQLYEIGPWSLQALVTFYL